MVLLEDAVRRPPARPDPVTRLFRTRAWLLAVLVHVGVRALHLGLLLAVGAAEGRSAHATLVRWDGQWYRRIAEHGYGHLHTAADGRLLSDHAFFPLYPATERVVAEVTGLEVVDAGLLVSAVSSTVAAAGIFLVSTRVLGPRAALLLVLLWSALPVAVVQSMAYSESLFTALAAWCLAAVLSQRFLAAGVLASLAGLTRPMGLAVVAAVVAAVAVHVRAARRTDPHSLLPGYAGAAVAPVGLVAFLAYVSVREGDVLGYLGVANRWGNGVDGSTAFVVWVLELLSGPQFLLGAVLLGALAVLVLLLAGLVRRGYPVALTAYAVVAVLIAFATAGYFGSKPRYLLPVFPLLMPVAAALAGRSRTTQVLASVGLALGSGLYGAFWLYGSGPP